MLQWHILSSLQFFTSPCNLQHNTLVANHDRIFYLWQRKTMLHICNYSTNEEFMPFPSLPCWTHVHVAPRLLAQYMFSNHKTAPPKQTNKGSSNLQKTKRTIRRLGVIVCRRHRPMPSKPQKNIPCIPTQGIPASMEAFIQRSHSLLWKQFFA